jgi:hypothetical protein
MPSKYQAGGGGSMGSNFGGRTTAAGGTRGTRRVVNKTRTINRVGVESYSRKDAKRMGLLDAKSNSPKQLRKAADKSTKAFKKQMKTLVKAERFPITDRIVNGKLVRKGLAPGTVPRSVTPQKSGKPGVSAVKPSLSKTAKPSAKTLKKGKK